ncbi:MAG: hypothetical protein JWR69_1361 [Pedosphaera sp.]|nr:hypothetical protein [Pedosphaera sp.]
MKSDRTTPKDIDSYIAGFPEDIQALLKKLRKVIHESAPGATECIKYQIPTFLFHGNLVHFAAFKKHIGFYPTRSGTEKFKSDSSDYDCSKGTIRFPLDKPIPFKLVSKIVAFRVRETLAKKK